jgi:geranylgeranyl pyrophosphate synthase
MKAAFFEMGDAHALETSLRGKTVTSPKEYLRIVEMKAASSEAVTKIGAIIGNGTKGEIEALARYGRIWGILSTIRNDFVDLFEIDELQNRMLNEILPLPILCAFEELSIKNKIVTILSKEKMTTKDLEVILKFVFEARQTKELKKMLQELIAEAISCLATLKRSKPKATLEMFVSAMLEDLD